MKEEYTSPEIRIIPTEHITLLAASSNGSVNTDNGDSIDFTTETDDSSGGRAKPFNRWCMDNEELWD